MRRWIQIGPTLFWMVQPPPIDSTFRTPSGFWRVVSVVESPEDRGWLVNVDDEEGRADAFRAA